MKTTNKNYPTLFKKLKAAINYEIKQNKIIVCRKKFRTNVGRAIPFDRWVKLPIISDLTSVYVAFHEIAHVIFKHHNPFKPMYTMEFEAERYALKKMRFFNIHKDFPKEYNRLIQSAKKYIISHILYSIERGNKIKNINKGIIQFCKNTKINPIIKQAEKVKKTKVKKSKK